MRSALGVVLDTREVGQKITHLDDLGFAEAIYEIDVEALGHFLKLDQAIPRNLDSEPAAGNPSAMLDQASWSTGMPPLSKP